MIFTLTCFSDSIFSFALSIHSASRLSLTFVLQNVAASSAFNGFVLSSLPTRFLEKSSLIGLEAAVALKLFYSVVIWFYFSGFCSSFITNVNPLLVSPSFWSSKSLSLFLYFFHLPANQTSALLRSFLNLLIFTRILLFQSGSFFSF